jgi:hypothetical protein
VHRQLLGYTERSMPTGQYYSSGIFIVVFNIDKASPLLTGWPPALSYQYTRFKFPLDISEDIMMKGGEELQRAIAALDPNVWNTEDKIYPATMDRARGLLAIVLNEILELSSGDLAECPNERIKLVLQTLHRNANKFLGTLWIE